jgi:hypothetical protein
MPHDTQTPPSVPQVVSSVPARQTPRGSKHPVHTLEVQRPSSQRSPAPHVPQKVWFEPHAAGSLLGAHVPSGRQHDVRHVHVGGPASVPASAIGTATHWLS